MTAQIPSANETFFLEQNPLAAMNLHFLLLAQPSFYNRLAVGQRPRPEAGGRWRWPLAGRRWPVAGGRWPVAGGRWPVAGGRWPVAGGRWPVAGGRWPVAGGRWPVAGGQWPVAGGRWPDIKKSLLWHSPAKLALSHSFGLNVSLLGPELCWICNTWPFNLP